MLIELKCYFNNKGFFFFNWDFGLFNCCFYLFFIILMLNLVKLKKLYMSLIVLLRFVLF